MMSDTCSRWRRALPLAVLCASAMPVTALAQAAASPEVVAAPALPPPAFPAPSAAESGVVRLTLSQAVELALAQAATLQSARAARDASGARVELARVPARPTAQLGATASVSSTPERACAGAPSQTCGGFFDPSAGSGLSAQLSWRLYDFGQTAASVRAAQAAELAAGAGVAVTELEVRTAAELAYLEAIARHHLVVVAQSTLDSEALHVEQARRFVAAGARDPIEVAQATARAASARSSLAQAQANHAIALGALRAAVGWLDPGRQVATELTWPTPPAADRPGLEALVAAARAKRPELARAEAQIAASSARVAAAEASRRPVLSAFANTQWAPSTGEATPEPSWTAGVSLSWTAWDGGRAAAERRVARADAAAAAAERDALLVALTQTLEAARARIAASTASVEAQAEAVTAAQAALRLAEARYTQGLGGQIEVADAQAALTVAQGGLVLAEWQLASSWAELRRALGE